MSDFSKLPLVVTNSSGPGNSQTIEIDERVVRVTEGRFPSTTKNWSESLSAFEGIVRRTLHHPPGPLVQALSSTEHRIELSHPHPTKTLTLFGSPELRNARRVWKDAARFLNLPAIEQTPDGPLVRQPEDLDKSIRALAAEGKLPENFGADPYLHPDTECRWREGIPTVILRPKWGHLGRDLVIFSLSATVFGLLFALSRNSDVVVASGVLFLCGLVAMSWGFLKRIAAPHITVTPSEIAYSGRTLTGRLPVKTIPLDELHTLVFEESALGRTPRGVITGVLVASEATEISSVVALIPPSPTHEVICLGRFIMAAAIGNHPAQKN